MEKRRCVPELIYRHRGYTSHDLQDQSKRQRLVGELNAAKEGSVWFSRLSDQNDPLDTYPAIVESSRAEVKRALNAFQKEYGSYVGFSGTDFKQAAKNLNIPVKRFREQFFDPDRLNSSVPKTLETSRRQQVICCFTDNPKSTLMWAYYSSSHQSFCYEFACAQEKLSDAKRTIGKVKYLADRPSISTVEAIRWMVRSSRKDNLPKSRELTASDEEEQKMTDALVLAKSEEWRHENEWRSIRPLTDGPGYYSVGPYYLKSVVFGINASQQLKEFVSETVGSAVAIRELKLLGHSYGLEFAN